MGSSCVLNKNVSLKIFRGVFYSYREITSSERNVDCLGLGLKSMISNGGWEVTTLTRVTDSRGTRSRVWVLVTVTYLVLSLSESATWNRQSIISNQKKENVLRLNLIFKMREYVMYQIMSVVVHPVHPTRKHFLIKGIICLWNRFQIINPISLGLLWSRAKTIFGKWVYLCKKEKLAWQKMTIDKLINKWHR